MTRVELTHTFPVSVGDAFAYITDTKNWNEFFPNFVRLHDPAHAKWDAPGDKVTVVIRLLGREVQVNMTLEVYERDNRVTYVSRQQGLPDASHEWHFRGVPEGFEFRPVVAFDPWSGLAGLFDRACWSSEPSQVHYGRQSRIWNRHSCGNARTRNHRRLR